MRRQLFVIATVWICSFLLGCSTNELPSQAIESHIQKGNLLLQNGEDEQALIEFEKAILLGSKDLKPLLHLVDLYFQKGDLQSAERVALETLEVYPEESNVLSLLANIHLAMGDVERAVSDYQRAGRQGGGSAWINAELLIKTLKSQEASENQTLHTLSQLHTAYPADIGVLKELGSFYKQKGDYRQALESYSEIISLNPSNDHFIYSEIGSCYLNLSEHEKAYEFFSKARQHGEFVPDHLFELLAKKLGRQWGPEELGGESEINYLMALKDKDELYRLAEKYEQRGDFDVLVRIYTWLKDNYPEESLHFSQLGFAYANLGYDKEALYYMTKAKQMGHPIPEIILEKIRTRIKDVNSK